MEAPWVGSAKGSYDEETTTEWEQDEDTLHPRNKDK